MAKLHSTEVPAPDYAVPGFPGDVGEEELFEPEGRRPLVWLAALVLVIVLASLAISHVVTRPKPSVALRPPAPPAAVSPVAVALAGARAYVLDGSTLGVYDVGSGGEFAEETFKLPPGRWIGRLAVDPTRGSIWVLNAQTSSFTQILEVDPATLLIVRTVRWNQVVEGAVALDGYLYLSTELGLAVLGPRATAPYLVPGLYGAVGPVAADPTRHRVIVIDQGFPTDVWAYRPGRPVFEAIDPVRIAHGTLAVVDGQVWVAGLGATAAVLQRLDPVSLLATGPDLLAEYGLATGLSVGAQIVATGSADLWLRADSGVGLWCVDPTRSTVRRIGQVSGTIAAGDGRVVAADSSGVIAIQAADCPG
jgi:hypothetical protein